MLLLISGEGVTDMGRCLAGATCQHPEFEPGPMALLADQIAETELGYPLFPHFMRLIPENALAARSKQLKPPKLRGRKHRRETTLFFKNARALAQCALELCKENEDEVIAILFRDADRTNGSDRGD